MYDKEVITFARLWLKEIKRMYPSRGRRPTNICPNLERLGALYNQTGMTCRRFCPLSSYKLDDCGCVETMEKFLHEHEEETRQPVFEF